MGFEKKLKICNVGIDEACHLVRKAIQHTVCRDVIEQINAHAKEIRQKKELKKLQHQR